MDPDSDFARIPIMVSEDPDPDEPALPPGQFYRELARSATNEVVRRYHEAQNRVRSLARHPSENHDNDNWHVWSWKELRRAEKDLIRVIRLMTCNEDERFSERDSWEPCSVEVNDLLYVASPRANDDHDDRDRITVIYPGRRT